MARLKRNEPAPAPEPQGELDVNSVVSYRIRTIRERRGWTQDFFADRLASYTGKKLPQASISLMERGFESNKRRRFDAQELYILSLVFEVPIVYFFIPPKNQLSAELLQSGRPASELYGAFVGIEDEQMLKPVDDALAEASRPDVESDAALEFPAPFNAIYGDGSAAARHRPKHFRQWRADRINRLAREFEDDMNKVRDTLAEIVTKLNSSGLQGWFAENAWNGDFDDQEIMGTLLRPDDPDD